MLRDQMLGKASGSGGNESTEGSEVSDDIEESEAETTNVLKRPAAASSKGKSSRQKTGDDEAHTGEDDEESNGDGAPGPHFRSFDAAMSNLPPIFEF